jgi:thioredoxin-related protein
MRSALRAFLLLALICSPIVSSRAGIDAESAIPTSSLELVVVEAEGCIYCKLFRRDVLPTYESSEQARDMPVHFVDINDIDANHLDFKTDVDIVPTFVVVKSRHEIGRISGYIGPENFFHSISYLLASSP